MELYSWERKLDMEAATYYIETQGLMDACRKKNRRDTYITWPHDLVLAYLVAVFRREGVDSKRARESRNMLVPDMSCWDSLLLIINRIEPYCTLFDDYR